MVQQFRPESLAEKTAKTVKPSQDKTKANPKKSRRPLPKDQLERRTSPIEKPPEEKLPLPDSPIPPLTLKGKSSEDKQGRNTQQDSWLRKLIHLTTTTAKIRFKARQTLAKTVPKVEEPLKPKPKRRRKRIQAPLPEMIPSTVSVAEVSPKPIRPAKKANKLVIYPLRLLIMGIGVGAVIGTVLSALDPTKPGVTPHPKDSTSPSPSATVNPVADINPSPNLALGSLMTGLVSKVETLTQKYPKLQAGVFLMDVDDNSYVDTQGDQAFSAASTIKVPILVAFFQDVDAGKIRLDEILTLDQKAKTSGSGMLQYRPLGTKLSALETATLMIIISDNTATNMLVNRLGGMESLNARFREWGLTQTAIHNILPDLEGTNTTSPKDLATLMVQVHQGHLISMKSRDRMLEIMQKTKNRSLLPSGLGKDALIAHKTGDIGTSLGDVGLVDLPNGKRYALSVIVKRPHNDPQARILIQEVSRTVYNHLLYGKSTPKVTN